MVDRHPTHQFSSRIVVKAITPLSHKFDEKPDRLSRSTVPSNLDKQNKNEEPRKKSAVRIIEEDETLITNNLSLVVSKGPTGKVMYDASQRSNSASKADKIKILSQSKGPSSHAANSQSSSNYGNQSGLSSMNSGALTEDYRQSRSDHPDSMSKTLPENERGRSKVRIQDQETEPKKSTPLVNKTEFNAKVRPSSAERIKILSDSNSTTSEKALSFNSSISRSQKSAHEITAALNGIEVKFSTIESTFLPSMTQNQSSSVDSNLLKFSMQLLEEIRIIEEKNKPKLTIIFGLDTLVKDPIVLDKSTASYYGENSILNHKVIKKIVFVERTDLGEPYLVVFNNLKKEYVIITVGSWKSKLLNQDLIRQRASEYLVKELKDRGTFNSDTLAKIFVSKYKECPSIPFSAGKAGKYSVVSQLVYLLFKLSGSNESDDIGELLMRNRIDTEIDFLNDAIYNAVRNKEIGNNSIDTLGPNLKVLRNFYVRT